MKGKGVGNGERVNTWDLILYVGATEEFSARGCDTLKFECEIALETVFGGITAKPEETSAPER